MVNKDDVRSFYTEASDAVWAFKYRLEQAASSVETDMPDYRALTKALKLLPLSSAIAILFQERDKLMRVVQSRGLAGDSRRSFLSELRDIALKSGDSEIAGLVTCSYVLEIVESTLLKPSEYSSGLNLLKAVRDDVSLSRAVRAEAALTIAVIWLKCGFLKEAAEATRNALHLSSKVAISARRFDTMGDIAMARGLYKQAYKKYKRATELDVCSKNSTKFRKRLVAKRVFAEMKSGSSCAVLREADMFIAKIKAEIKDDVFYTGLTLETMKQFRQRYPLGHHLLLDDALAKVPSLWRERSKLNLSIADYLIEIDQYDQAYKYLNYVMRMATQYENPVDTVDVFLLSAKACCCQGRFLEALRALRIVRGILGNQHHSGKFGLTYLLRAKVAFFRNKTPRAERLSKKAYILFVKGGDCRHSVQAVWVVAATAIWLGSADAGCDIFARILSTLHLEHTTPEILMIIHVGLASACYANNKPKEAVRWLQMCRKLAEVHDDPKICSLKYLSESEEFYFQQELREAKRAAKLALKYAKQTGHLLLQALCQYQFVKVLISNKEREAAKEFLQNAERDYPYCTRVMWRPLAGMTRKTNVKLSDFRPLGSFPL